MSQSRSEVDPFSSQEKATTKAKRTSTSPSNPSTDAILAPVAEWFRKQDWNPFPFQYECWQAYLNGHSGLLLADTGMGKTYAALMAGLAEARHAASASTKQSLQILWLTPLRALAKDTENAVRAACEGMGLDWEIILRTSDTTARVKQKLRKSLPEVLITTPESLSLLLSYPNRRRDFETLRLLVVDEWHELMGTKRGVQTELALARLRQWCPSARVWGVSATIGNVDEARNALLGSRASEDLVTTVKGPSERKIEIESLVPQSIERFPWAGHLGTRLVEAVATAIEGCKTSLVFTNTRSQTEQWYQELLQVRPEWAGQIAVHHSSLEPKVRLWVESRLDAGELKAVVCTSSLDLGVDFQEVEQVFQVGSPKGVARLMQRAGRSGHRPGEASRLVFVPTHAFELVEITAARSAMLGRRIESRTPIEKPLDVLAQHVVTISCGDGFTSQGLYQEITSTWSYRHLSDEEWKWVLDFVQRGGPTLDAYPDYRRVSEKGNVYQVASPAQARRHRMNMGTISSDQSLRVKYIRGAALGSVEESFLSRLKPGDPFIIAGRVVELVRVRDMVAYVRKAKRKRWNVPRWVGGRLPLSTELGREVREQLQHVRNHDQVSPQEEPTIPEWEALQPLFHLQHRWSVVPKPDELLIEQFKVRDGCYTVAYLFEGRAVHEGLASLWAYRLGQSQQSTYGIVVNDYAIALVSPEPIPVDRLEPDVLTDIENLPSDIIESLNLSQMMRFQFRDIARIAGLVTSGFPNRGKSAKQLQASSNLFFDVFGQYDPKNLLLEQARREVLAGQLQWEQLTRTMQQLKTRTWRIVNLKRPTPFAFPLVVERLRDRVSTETLLSRVRKMQESLEREASKKNPPHWSSRSSSKSSPATSRDEGAQSVD